VADRDICDKPEPTTKNWFLLPAVHPSIYGWQPIAKLCPELRRCGLFRRIFSNWAAGVVMVVSALFSNRAHGLSPVRNRIVAGRVSGISALFIFKNLSRQGWSTFSGPSRLNQRADTRLNDQTIAAGNCVETLATAQSANAAEPTALNFARICGWRGGPRARFYCGRCAARSGSRFLQ